ncbi:MAG: response regulator receiver protein [Anaerolineae bacterium]|nr:response regulator receiver protein [Anaerolineae bacterium]
MFFTEWEILLVDDEVDVLSISKLAMKDFTVYGLPLKIHTAQSKAKAIEFMNSRPDQHLSRLALGFIDVVMESDHAGLELCRHIRQDRNNTLTQLYIRTGQPGIAPERTVIDQYEISGYFTKAEATEDKLYSLVKSGVRQYLSEMMSVGSFAILAHAIANAASRADVEAGLQAIMTSWDGEGALARAVGQRDGIAHALLLNGQVLHLAGAVDEQTAQERVSWLEQAAGQSLNTDGDKYVADDNGNHLIDITAQPDSPSIQWYFKTSFEPPAYCISLSHQAFKSIATVWQQAG